MLFAGGIGTVSAVNADSYDALGNPVPQIYRGRKREDPEINLIPFNEWPGAPYRRSSWDRIEAFADIIYKAGYASPIRTPRGEDIMAACGQLKSATERGRKSAAQVAAEAGI